MIIVVGLSGCKTESIYPNMTQFRYDDGQRFTYYYLLQSKTHNEQANTKLLICLDGKEKHSVLGTTDFSSWATVSIPYFLQQFTLNNYHLLVLDKINAEPGQDFANNPDIVGANNFSDMTNTYAAIIDAFIETHPHYSEIYLFGFSEGGVVLPKLYLALKYSARIRKLVLCSSGGLSYYESLKIQQQTPHLFSATYNKDLKELDAQIPKIKQNPMSIHDTYFGWPYIVWSDILTYRPLDDLAYISIPILVTHGDADKNIPVESARAIETRFMQLGKPNLTYIEFKNSNHYYNGNFQLLISQTLNWLNQAP